MQRFIIENYDSNLVEGFCALFDVEYFSVYKSLF